MAPCDTRGNLFHFRLDSDTIEQTLRVDDDYEAIAFVAYTLMQKSLVDLYLKIDNVYSEIIEKQRAQEIDDAEAVDNSTN